MGQKEERILSLNPKRNGKEVKKNTKKKKIQINTNMGENK